MPMVFVYGPDALQARIYDRVGPSNVIAGALLPDYRLRFNKPSMKNKAEGLANLIAESGASTFGVLYDLSRAQIDTLEGYYGGYVRQDVRVRPIPPAEAEEGAPALPEKVEAIVLLARRTASQLKPTKAALDAAKKGARENGAPDEFLKELEALKGIDG